MTRSISVLFIALIVFSDCRNSEQRKIFSSEDSLRIVNEIAAYRSEKNLDFYFQSKLYRYEKPETVIVLGTRGEEREQLKYGYFLLQYNGDAYKRLVQRFNIYTIDLNKAYNPYCAYSSLYSCAIPRDEDFLKFAVRAGEKNYHN